MKGIQKGIVILAIVLGAFAMRQYLFKKESQIQETANMGRREKIFAQMVEKENKTYQFFIEKFPTREILLACEEDLNNDGRKDLLVIYKEGKDTRLVGICDKEREGYHITEEIHAPVEKQTIQFINMDKKDEMEFIVTGEKNGQVGYGIYRIIDGEIKDLFGEGMNECC